MKTKIALSMMALLATTMAVKANPSLQEQRAEGISRTTARHAASSAKREAEQIVSKREADLEHVLLDKEAFLDMQVANVTSLTPKIEDSSYFSDRTKTLAWGAFTATTVVTAHAVAPWLLFNVASCAAASYAPSGLVSGIAYEIASWHAATALSQSPTVTDAVNYGGAWIGAKLGIKPEVSVDAEVTLKTKNQPDSSIFTKMAEWAAKPSKVVASSLASWGVFNAASSVATTYGAPSNLLAGMAYKMGSWHAATALSQSPTAIGAVFYVGRLMGSMTSTLCETGTDPVTAAAAA